MAGPFHTRRDQVIGISLLLFALLAVFFLRVPCNPLVAYGPSAQFRTHRSHALPSCAILSDFFCAVVLIALPISLTATAVETCSPPVFSIDHYAVLTTLRC
jgi:hypothetical protein